MFAKNVNGKLEFPPQNKGNILNYNQNTSMLEADGYIDYSEAEIALYKRGYGFGFDKNNSIVDISNTSEYLELQKAKENKHLKMELTRQIDEIDKKRIRAICEPSIKDEEIGQTWLEYYNEQIHKSREEIIKLETEEITNDTNEN